MSHHWDPADATPADLTGVFDLTSVVDGDRFVWHAATSKLVRDTATPITQATADGRYVRKDSGGLEELDTHGAAAVGATETIDLANGNVHKVILDENCTLTFSGSTASVACSFTLLVVQDGTGGNTITWPASVDWAGASPPTQSTGANEVDIYTFVTIDNGTTWFGFQSGKDMG